MSGAAAGRPPSSACGMKARSLQGIPPLPRPALGFSRRAGTPSTPASPPPCVLGGGEPADRARRRRLHARPSGTRPERPRTDFFVAVPGLGARPLPPGEMTAIDIDFDRESTQVFRIGAASCAVPGAAAGLEAAHCSYGSLPWGILFEPALELARGGGELTRPPAYLHAILDLILRHTPEGRRIYGRRSRLVAGDRLVLDDLGSTSRTVRSGRRDLRRLARKRDPPPPARRGRDAHDRRPRRVPGDRGGRCACASAATSSFEPAAVVRRGADRLRPAAARRARSAPLQAAPMRSQRWPRHARAGLRARRRIATSMGRSCRTAVPRGQRPRR